jgi:hypothetical protein
MRLVGAAAGLSEEAEGGAVMDRVVDVSDNDGRRPSVYCPRCRQSRRREEWRRVFRHLRSGSEEGRPVEVLRHRDCDEIVYVLI